MDVDRAALVVAVSGFTPVRDVGEELDLGVYEPLEDFADECAGLVESALKRFGYRTEKIHRSGGVDAEAGRACAEGYRRAGGCIGSSPGAAVDGPVCGAEAQPFRYSPELT